MKREQIALQLYTVRQHTAEDMIGTLRQLAEMGYQAVEFAGYGNADVPEIRRALDEYGLRAIGAHVQFAAFDGDPSRVFADMHALGCEFAVLPSLRKEQRENADQARQLVDKFNRWGERCKAEGLQFGYHNHAFEFEPLGDTTLFDILTTTDPELVALELDIFWAQYAGVDPFQLIERHGHRMPLLHMKDMEPGPERKDAPVGEGTLPYDSLIPAGENAGARWFIVEQDHPRDPLNDVRRSFQNLAKMASA